MQAHEKLPANIVWLAIGHELCGDILLILAHRIKKKEYTLTIGLPLLIFFFQEGLVEEKGRNAFVFTGKYMYIS